MGMIRWAVVVGLSAVMFLSASPLFAQGRDPDGTRMQARAVEVGSTFQDSLSPPQDQADWRMVRLSDSQALDLRLTVRTSGATAQLILTDSRGDRIETVTAGAEAGRITRRVDAGIYYVAVESEDTLRYELSIR